MAATEDRAMIAPARAMPATRPSALAILGVRCEARALLWQAGEIDLHSAVDDLQASAVASGLVAEIGQDAVQEIITRAFKAVQ
jgi:hypothetical protein